MQNLSDVIHEVKFKIWISNRTSGQISFPFFRHVFVWSPWLWDWTHAWLSAKGKQRCHAIFELDMVYSLFQIWNHHRFAFGRIECHGWNAFTAKSNLNSNHLTTLNSSTCDIDSFFITLLSFLLALNVRHHYEDIKKMSCCQMSGWDLIARRLLHRESFRPWNEFLLCLTSKFYEPLACVWEKEEEKLNSMFLKKITSHA